MSCARYSAVDCCLVLPVVVFPQNMGISEEVAGAYVLISQLVDAEGQVDVLGAGPGREGCIMNAGGASVGSSRSPSSPWARW